MDPAVQQVERHVDGGEEERHEHGCLHQRPGLDRPEPHRDAARPEKAHLVEDDREPVEPEEVDPVPAHLHARCEPDRRQDRGEHRPADEGCEAVAEDDPGALRRGDEEPAGEAPLEVARDAEAGEDPAERGRLGATIRSSAAPSSGGTRPVQPGLSIGVIIADVAAVNENSEHRGFSMGSVLRTTALVSALASCAVVLPALSFADNGSGNRRASMSRQGLDTATSMRRRRPVVGRGRVSTPTRRGA